MAGNVLVCVTGQKTCVSLIVEGARLAKEAGAQVSVLHVVKPGASVFDNVSEGDALEYLFRVASEHGADMAMIRSNDVAATICAHAEKVEAALIVMGKADGKRGRELSRQLSALKPDISIYVPSGAI